MPCSRAPASAQRALSDADADTICRSDTPAPPAEAQRLHARPRPARYVRPASTPCRSPIFSLRLRTDLTLPLVAEKAPLPAIIVTPSSPSSTRDFAIAFLAPPAAPALTLSLRQRLAAHAPGARIRVFALLLLVLVVLAFHAAVWLPRLAFAGHPAGSGGGAGGVQAWLAPGGHTHALEDALLL